MLKVGLTGGMGSGKSVVANIFRVLEIPVLDADRLAKKIMNSDVALKNKIKAVFGEATYTAEGLNRKFLADIVFRDPLRLEALNALVHPATLEAAQKWFSQQRAPYAVKEAALIFESGSGAGLDYIIGVSAPETLRINRVMKRDQLNREEILHRMDQQLAEDIKMKLCDFVLVNDEKTLLIPQVLRLHEIFNNLSKQKQ